MTTRAAAARRIRHMRRPRHSNTPAHDQCSQPTEVQHPHVDPPSLPRAPTAGIQRRPGPIAVGVTVPPPPDPADTIRPWPTTETDR